MVTDGPYQIALWGLPRVGKTALLAYLIEAAAKTEWDVQPETESWPFVTSMREQLIKNEFPAPTAMGHTDIVVYRLTRGARQAVLRVEDIAGGKWIEHKADQLAMLRNADAIVLVIDPNKPPLIVEKEIRTMLDLFSLDGSSGVDYRPVAVCVTKVDALIERPEDLDEAQNDPKTFVARRLSRVIRAELRRVVERRCPNHKFFPISAVGVRVQSGVIRQAVLLDERLRLRPTSSGTPLNLTSPFDWIFDRLASPV